MGREACESGWQDRQPPTLPRADPARDDDQTSEFQQSEELVVAGMSSERWVNLVMPREVNDLLLSLLGMGCNVLQPFFMFIFQAYAYAYVNMK